MALGMRYPERIDTGGVYRWPPYKQNTSKNYIIGKEIIFDFDEWNWKSCEICTKKEGKIICAKCYSHEMLPKISIIINILRQEFYCDRIYVFFSGARSLHIWVKDYNMVLMSNNFRMQLVEHLSKCTNVVIDKEVAAMQHLIRLPFSINTSNSTNNVCVPVNINNPGNFPAIKCTDSNSIFDSLRYFNQI